MSGLTRPGVLREGIELNLQLSDEEAKEMHSFLEPFLDRANTEDVPKIIEALFDELDEYLMRE